MLAGGFDVDYRRALAYSHRPTTRIEVYSAAGVLIGLGLPKDVKLDGTPVAPVFRYGSAAVTATLTSRVSRTLNMTVPANLYPWADTDTLAPFGNYVRAFRGVRYGSTPGWEWEVFRGRINDAALAMDDTVAITCQDLAVDVVESGFEMPRQSSTPATTVQVEYERLVREALPDATFAYAIAPRPYRVPSLTWEYDRGRALDDLATGIGSFWYALADGTFTLLPVPWAAAEVVPVATIADGKAGDRDNQIINGSTVRVSRDGVYNATVVSGERADGSPPVTYIARNLNPGSPLYFGGPFGRKVKPPMQLQGVTTLEQARIAAVTALRRAGALSRPWAVDIIPDAALELGDALEVAAKGRRAVQVIAGFSLPLVSSGLMRIALRDLDPGVIV